MVSHGVLITGATGYQGWNLYGREKGKDEEGKVVFEDVEFLETVRMLTGVEELEYNCPSCQKQVIASK